jgi:hypothetical protein
MKRRDRCDAGGVVLVSGERFAFFSRQVSEPDFMFFLFKCFTTHRSEFDLLNSSCCKNISLIC